ncbi:MAG: bifunctional 23S rRNA (guanine(2069)-N(7))-methyltransferase RlmK/23S rRNA (guanine(2445)-N(2))-methyltransferase RlmL [Magnetococcus sp. DMHC-6]
MAQLLVRELTDLGAGRVRETSAGVSFRGDLELAMRVCLWSRLANRVLLQLKQVPANHSQELYQGVQLIDWREHVRPNGSLLVDFIGVNATIRHTHFGAQVVKDAIVDQFRQLNLERPNVRVDGPDLRINVRLRGDQATIAVDLSGESLHRRGYRVDGAAPAPLKENLAAALLTLAGWPEILRRGLGFFDPMCGSATLPIEAALMAGDVAPGLGRGRFGLQTWLGYDPLLWEKLLVEAEDRAQAGQGRIPAIVGCDRDPKMVQMARGYVDAAGLSGKIKIFPGELSRLHLPNPTPGLLLVNPPYGERQNELDDLVPLYQGLELFLNRCPLETRIGVFTALPHLLQDWKMPVTRAFELFNGAIPCQLVLYTRTQPKVAGVYEQESIQEDPGAPMYANRLRKNFKHLSSWARKNHIHCFRVYDADIPEYAAAVDLYENWLCVQEYRAPVGVDQEKARLRLQTILSVTPDILGVPAENVFLKVRQRQTGGKAHVPRSNNGKFYPVREQDLQFLVNFVDHLDTGLFLDHAPTRRLLRQLAQGRRFLNLFGYTGTATVAAAAGGAVSTVTVDLSNTYLDWAKRNMGLNGFSGAEHRFVQADCLAWLLEESQKSRFDLIFLDPPTFSNSKRMKNAFELQQEHVHLIQSVLRFLSPNGDLIFSNNYRYFKMDLAQLPSNLEVTNITASTLDLDFRNNPRIHHCWRIRYR